MLPVAFSSEPVLAVRCWEYDEYQDQCCLHSMFRLQPLWFAAVPMLARCSSPAFTREHKIHHTTPAPVEECRCGIYGVAPNRIEILPYQSLVLGDFNYIYTADLSTVVAGVVALWGKVIVGDNGIYRAQYGYPAALFAAAGVPLESAFPRIAQKYQMSLLPFPESRDHLEALIRELRRTLVAR